MLSVTALVIMLSFSSLFNRYHCYSDERKEYTLSENDGKDHFVLIEEENDLFVRSGICSLENQTQLQLCNFDENQTVRSLLQLQNLSCYCDYSCHAYGDCCINRIGYFDYKRDSLSCRTVRSPKSYSIPIYVYQKCPKTWDNDIIKDLCEMEATERYTLGLDYDHRQDLPVFSNSFGMFYRNVFCAICNKDTNLEKWDTHLYCNGDIGKNKTSSIKIADFSSTIYNPRSKNYRGVKIDGIIRNCVLIVRNFEIRRLIMEYGGRLCKNVIDSCPPTASSMDSEKCKMYSSYVYRTDYTKGQQEIYKNFHCALCHNIPIDYLTCYDPKFPVFFGTTWQGKLGISVLFDFNFQGDSKDTTCQLSSGQMWDPLFGKCQNITCGALYVKKDDKCIPLNITGNKEGIKRDCFKKILKKEQFSILPNRKVYVNFTGQIYAQGDYEIFENNSNQVLKIAICLDSQHQLLPISDEHYWLSVITLSISIICLVLHLAVYGLFKSLRNFAAKILMSLSSSLLCGHFFLLVGPQFHQVYWFCYISSILTHFGYLSAFLWMNVMAYDMYKTFSVMQTHTSTRNKVFAKYSIYAWLVSICVVSLSITIDNVLFDTNIFRPKYGEPICWFNQRYGLLLFFMIPVAIVILANIFLFIYTALYFWKVTKETRLVNRFSDKLRYFLYLKLTVVFGLAWILGFIAATTRLEVFWYPFIILNGLQGALIFLCFTVKKDILNMIAIKFKLRSSKYQMGRKTGLKAAMYNSLSNISARQTTFSTQISTTTDSNEILKSVKKLNPDLITDIKISQ